MPSDLVVLDGVAFSLTPEGPWVPMSTTTGIFHDTKRHHNHPHHHPEAPMMYKWPTTQS